MSNKVSLKDATRTNWCTYSLNTDEYPGDKNIELGCLMRIADSTEQMAKNYQKLQTDLDLYKQWFESDQEMIAFLNRRVSALKGVISRMKKIN